MILSRFTKVIISESDNVILKDLRNIASTFFVCAMAFGLDVSNVLGFHYFSHGPKMVGNKVDRNPS